MPVESQVWPIAVIVVPMSVIESVVRPCVCPGSSSAQLNFSFRSFNKIDYVTDYVPHVFATERYL